MIRRKRSVAQRGVSRIQRNVRRTHHANRSAFRLDGRTAIVTGGASRFGSPISRALAQAGANVMIASRRLQPCEELALELREEGLSAHALQVDLADDDSIRQLAQACAEKFGGIDILVNNAVSREFADELEELDRTSVMASMEVK